MVRSPAQPGVDVEPDHLTVYLTLSPAASSLTSVPSPGKQSVVDHIRVPSAALTVKVWIVPERSCWQGCAPVLVTTMPSTGWPPAAKLGAAVTAVTDTDSAAQISLPAAS